MCPITFFEDKRVIDVSCGDRFTVVVAEEAIDSRPNTASQQEEKINDDELTSQVLPQEFAPRSQPAAQGLDQASQNRA